MFIYAGNQEEFNFGWNWISCQSWGATLTNKAIPCCKKQQKAYETDVKLYIVFQPVLGYHGFCVWLIY